MRMYLLLYFKLYYALFDSWYCTSNLNSQWLHMSEFFSWKKEIILQLQQLIIDSSFIQPFLATSFFFFIYSLYILYSVCFLLLFVIDQPLHSLFLIGIHLSIIHLSVIHLSSAYLFIHICDCLYVCIFIHVLVFVKWIEFTCQSELSLHVLISHAYSCHVTNDHEVLLLISVLNGNAGDTEVRVHVYFLCNHKLWER